CANHSLANRPCGRSKCSAPSERVETRSTRKILITRRSRQKATRYQRSRQYTRPYGSIMRLTRCPRLTLEYLIVRTQFSEVACSTLRRSSVKEFTEKCEVPFSETTPNAVAWRANSLSCSVFILSSILRSA